MLTAPLTEIEDLLRNTMGLDPASLGGDGVWRAVKQLMEKRGLNDAADYAGLLRESNEELQKLIEAVVVPETWFFRHIEAFQALTEWVQNEWLSAPRSSQLRILSAPCSTGEEPYSIAMALRDAGFPETDLALDAMDISRDALAHAEQGIYRDNSFRSAHLSFRDRYFSRKDGVYQISPEIRKMVRFRLDNLLSQGFNAAGGFYDVIFCRNVLIYFGPEKQRQVLAAVSRLLAPSGVLFAGPAEGVLVMEAGFSAISQRMSFGFKRRTESTASTMAPKPKQSRAPAAHRTIPVRTPDVANKPRLHDKQNGNDGKVGVENPLPDLETARAHADAGRLSDAVGICEQLLGRPPVSADVYALLGVVQDALGRMTEAEESYRRAIYLDPAHHQALSHLAALADRRNDSATAKRLRDRAKRGTRS